MLRTIDAFSGGVQLNNFADYKAKKFRVKIMEFDLCPERQEDSLNETLTKVVGKVSYGYGQLIGDIWVSLKEWVGLPTNNPIKIGVTCSELCARDILRESTNQKLKKTIKRFGPDGIAPDRLLIFMESHDCRNVAEKQIGQLDFTWY
jgi:hypothetical protein